MANNVLGRRQIVIRSAQGPTSISHVLPPTDPWAYTILPGLVKNYSLPAQVSGNNYGTLVYTVNGLRWVTLRRQVYLFTLIRGDNVIPGFR